MIPKTLKDNEQLLNVFVKDIPLALAMFDREMRYLYASDRWRHDYGLGDCQLEGISHYEIFPEIPEKWREAHRRGMAGEALRAEADRFERLDGSVQWVRWELRPWHNKAGEIGGLVIFTEDVTDIKLAGQELQKKENLYRELVQNANSAIIRWKADGTLTFFNEYAQRLFGYSIEEVIGRQVNFLLPEKESTGDDLSGLVRDIVDHPEKYKHNVNENITRDGRRLWMSWTNRPLFSDGELKEILAVGSDVTEQKLAEDALRESEERFRALVESAAQAVWETDARGVVVKSSPSWGAYTGQDPEHILGYGWLEALHPDDRAEIEKRWRETVGDGQSHFTAEFRLRGPSGWRWTQAIAAPLRDSEGNVEKWVGMNLDITDRKTAEAKLASSEEKYRAIFEQAAVGIARVRFADAHWIDVNQAFCDMVGYPPAELRNIPWLDITHPEDIDLDLIPFRRMAAGELDTYSVEKRFIHKQGHPVWTRLTLSLVQDGQGAPDYQVAVVENITEQKRVEEVLLEAKLMAEKASQAKSEFLANMSHEIRTPMTVFLGAIEHLQQVDQDPDHQTLLMMADQSASHLRKLIDDILDFSRIEAGKVKIEEESTNLQMLLVEIAAMFQGHAEQKGLKLSLDLAADVPHVILADMAKLKQVLVNLTDNAIKFTAGGEVRLALKARDDVLEFAVVDTGIGIPEDKQNLLFKYFSQVDTSFHRKHGGTGLGLAISRKLVELMGGRISVQSQAGKGCVFSFTIPVKLPGPVGSAEQIQAEDARVNPAAVCILLAEDNPMICDVISGNLGLHGWRTETAVTGREALAKWRQGVYDVILMDLQMPDMDGFEATETIRREEPQNKHVPIIGFTAHAQKEVLDKCLAAGMDRVLTKPVVVEKLRTTIEDCLAG